MFGINEQGQVTFNGKPVSDLTEEERRNAYGSAGNIGLGEIQSFDFTTGAKPRDDIDSRYFESYEINLGDAGTTRGYRLKPEYERMQGMAQVGMPRSMGGYGEPLDPSLITYDEEFGYITPLTNIKPPDSNFLEENLVYILALGMGGAIAATGGLSGLGIGAAAEAGTAGGSTTGLGQYAGMTTGLDGAVAGTGATTGATTGGIVSGATETALAGTGTATSTGVGAGGGSLGLVSGLEPIVVPSTNLTAPTLASLPNVGGSGVLGGLGDWFTRLNPMAQRAIMSSLSTGASAIMAGRRQESAQDFARQQQERQYEIRRQEEERAAEERRIRGTPQQYTFNVTPRTPRTGIIGGGMGG